MKNVRLFQIVAWGVLAAALAAVATSWWVKRIDDVDDYDERIIEAAWVGYETFDEALDSVDAVVVVSPSGEPTPFVDHGADGRPDFSGDPGVDGEVIPVTVLDVLRGDEGLRGMRLTLAQPAATTSRGEGGRDRLVGATTTLLLASEVRANPGVLSARGGESLWVPLGAGQGVFDVDADGVVTPRIGVFSETFRTGVDVTTADLRRD